MFFVAFLPQFVDASAGAARQLWTLVITCVTMATLNTMLYAVFGGAARKLSLLSVAGVWALLAKRPA
jgi:threonine/homoserine/homoserine lactone efflux protein